VRIVVWNCRGGLAAKLPVMRALGAQIAVVCEARVDGACIPHGRASGLGVLALGRSRITGWRPVEGVRHALVARVEGTAACHVVAVWAHPTSGSYVRTVDAVVAAESELLASGQAVFAGDLNALCDPSGGGAFRSTVERLSELGLISAYHVARGEPFGRERQPTHYWRYQRRQRWHIDYCFVPAAWQLRRVTVGSFRRFSALGSPARSDHVPLVVDALPR
jgi:endonuclease/exonuclease/phosphatase family metal-dependent hydrolase